MKALKVLGGILCIVIALLWGALKIASYALPVIKVVDEVQRAEAAPKPPSWAGKPLSQMTEDERQEEEKIFPSLFRLEVEHSYYPTVLEVRPASAAQAAGLHVGDQLLSFDGAWMGRDSAEDSNHMKDACQACRNKEVSMVVRRAGDKVVLTARVPGEGVLGFVYHMEKWAASPDAPPGKAKEPGK